MGSMTCWITILNLTYPELWSCFLWIFRLADPSFTLVVSGTPLLLLPLWWENWGWVQYIRWDIRKIVEDRSSCQPNPKPQSTFSQTSSDAPRWTNISTHVFGCWTILLLYSRLCSVVVVVCCWSLLKSIEIFFMTKEMEANKIGTLSRWFVLWRHLGFFNAKRTSNPRVNLSNG